MATSRVHIWLYIVMERGIGMYTACCPNLDGRENKSSFNYLLHEDNILLCLNDAGQSDDECSTRSDDCKKYTGF